MSTRILLADDQVLFVEGLRSVFETRADDFEIVGIAHDGQEAIEKTEALLPDIVLMDVRMPGIDGVEATRRIHRTHPHIKIVMLTTYDDDQYVKQAVKNGAIGYLLKDVPPNELFNSVRAARDGSFILPSSLASKLISDSDTEVYHGGISDVDLPEWYYELSRKERHILRMVIEGYDNTEIADEVNLATQTVKNYISQIYSKLDVHGRLEAIKKGRSLIKFL